MTYSRAAVYNLNYLNFDLNIIYRLFFNIIIIIIIGYHYCYMKIEIVTY